MKYLITLRRLPAFLLAIGLILTLALGENFAQITVNGSVKNSDTQEPIPGVNVIIKNTTNATVTGVDGSFQIEVPDQNTILVFSSIGFVKTEVVVGNQTSLNVSLKEDIEALSEVVIIGYGEQSTKEVSTAVSTVDTKTIESLPIYRTEQALQGTSPGIVVVQESGSPGAPLTVRVRGLSSANSSNPLYLVDGIQVPNLDYLNSDDIDNISILKDAAASAIYGARGGNGVVLVTTKSGRRNDGIKVSVNGYYGTQGLLRQPDLMNRDQWVEYYNNSVDYYQNRGLTGPVLTDDDTPLRFSDADRARLPDTDWYDELFGNAPMYNINASVSGGGEKHSWILSGGYFGQDGILGADQGSKSSFDRYSVRGSFETDIAKGLNLQIGGSVVRTERDFLFENSGAPGTSIMNYINNLAPIYPVFDAASGEIFNPGRLTPQPVFTDDQGQITLPAVGAITNPLVSLLLTNNEALNNINTVNTGLSYEIGKFKFSTTFSYYISDALNRGFAPQYNFPTQSLANDPNTYTETTTKFWRTQWDNLVTYNHKTENGHSFEVLAGMSIIQDELNVSQISGSDFFSNDFDEVNFGLIKDITSVSLATPFVEENGWRSFFGRINYSYNEKYLLAVTLRHDASSKFGENNRSGIFPSISAGWNISEEAFLAGSEFVNLLKLRASWGVNGNDQIPAYQYLNTVSTTANYVVGNGGQTLTDGLFANGLGNPDIKWEEVSQFNVGLDANLFNNRLGVTVDYFIKKTTDMLIPGVGTPILVGLNPPFRNAADVENKGWEILTTYKTRVNDDFAWNIGFNLATVQNEVTSLGGGEPIDGGFDRPAWEAPISRTDVGQPIASFYGFEVSGLDDNGELVFVDRDGEDGISVDDKTFIGNPFPDFTYGINGGVEFKGFDFNFFFYGSQGNDIYKSFLRPDAVNLQRSSDLAAWTPTSTDIVRSNLFGNSPNLAEVSEHFIEDGSFLKLKTVTLGYTLPESISKKLKASKIRVYVTAQNLFVITGYSGVDPEIGQSSSNSFLDLGIDRGFHPQPRTILGGFQISLF